MARALFGAYDRLLRRFPLSVKMATSATLVCASDITVQLGQQGAEGYNPKRTLIIGVGYGGLWFAPILHGITTTWARVMPSTTASALALKTLVDMTTGFPLNLSAMIGLQAIVRDEDPVSAIKTNLMPSLWAGWGFWPFMTVAMYKVVPLHYRVLFLNVGSFFWNIFMISRFEAPDSLPSRDNI
jgi:protein Mpv17